MRVDLWGLTALLCVAAFLFFRAALTSFPWACAATGGFACALILLMRACDERFGAVRRARRKRLAQAAALVARWAMKPDEGAARRCVRQVFGEEAADVRLIPRHAAGRPLDCSELLMHWRAAGETPRLMLLCTGAVEPAALALAETLRDPQIALLDMRRLRDVVADSDLDLPDPPKTRFVARLTALKPDRAKSGRCARYAALSLICYVLLGRIVYLIAALPLIALAVMGFRRGGTGERLWPGG